MFFVRHHACLTVTLQNYSFNLILPNNISIIQSFRVNIPEIV